MEKKHTSKKNKNNSFKIIIIILTFALLGSFFYIYKISDRTKNVIVDLKQQNATFANEKETILKNLEKSKLLLDEALTGKSKLSQQLVEESEKVKSLIAELQNTKLDQKKFLTLKKGANDADTRILALIREVNLYKNKIDSTNVVLKQERRTKDTLLHSNKRLNSKISNAAKLNYYSFYAKTYKAKGSGKLIETDNANRVNLIKINFIIGENSLVAQENKEYYAQVIDSKNNVIGDKKTENIAGKNLVYSSVKKIKYINKSVEIDFNIPVEELFEGTYYINIFDKTNPILNTSFTLK